MRSSAFKQWVGAMLVLALGLLQVLHRPLPAIPLFLACLIILPPTWALIQRRINFKVHMAARIAVIVLLFAAWAFCAERAQTLAVEAETKATTEAAVTAAEKAKKGVADYYELNATAIQANIDQAIQDGDFVTGAAKCQKFLAASNQQLAEPCKRVAIGALVRELNGTPEDSHAANVRILTQLAAYFPDNEDYKSRLAAQRAQLIAQNTAEIAARKAAADNAAAQADKNKQVATLFSPWDGSLPALESFIKSGMRDPSSYEHVQTTYNVLGDEVVVHETYRGKNAFNAIMTESVTARANLNGGLISVIDHNGQAVYP